MTGKELRTFLKAWIEFVLIDEQGQEGLEVISSNRNAPSSENPYITIQYNGGRGRFGRPSKSEVYFNEEDPDDEKNGTRTLVSDWNGSVLLWETFGDGDFLRILIDSLDREDIISTYFSANNLAVLSAGEILPSPRITNDSWVKESSVELQVSITESTRESTGYISTVEYELNIRGGSHNE